MVTDMILNLITKLTDTEKLMIFKHIDNRPDIKKIYIVLMPYIGYMYCTKLFLSLEKRLEEKKSLNEIGQELCDTVDDPRGKAIRLIKINKGEKYLIDNADWLGYQVQEKGTKKFVPFEETPFTESEKKLNTENICIEREVQTAEGSKEFQITDTSNEFCTTYISNFIRNLLKTGKSIEDCHTILSNVNLEKINDEIKQNNSKLTVKLFTSTQCGACIGMAAMVQPVTKLFKNVEFVHYESDKYKPDENMDKIFIKHNIKYTPTIFVFKNDKMIKKVEYNELDKVLKEFSEP